jgi:phosphoribosylanthranilate isomerase
MVDVASGVESAPGLKDLARVNAFIKATRPRPADLSPRDLS